MKVGYVISHYGAEKPDFVFLYNWHGINEIGLAGYCKDYTVGIPTENLVAIFKIKYK